MHVFTPLCTFTTIEYIEKLLEEISKVCKEGSTVALPEAPEPLCSEYEGPEKSSQLANTKYASVSDYTHIITNLMVYMYMSLLTSQHKRDVDNIKVG